MQLKTYLKRPEIHLPNSKFESVVL